MTKALSRRARAQLFYEINKIEGDDHHRDLLRRAKGQQHNAGHYFYDTGAQALPPDGKPGGRWAVVDYAGVTRLRTRSRVAARRYARKSYIAGVVRRWRGQAVAHG